MYLLKKILVKRIKKKIFLIKFVNVSKKFRFNNKVYLTLLLSNNKKIKVLNKRFKNKNKHTDILSFPFNQKSRNLKEIYLGDIIISFNCMNKPKNLSNREFKKKTIKIFIHGFLHLLGFNHVNSDKDYKKCIVKKKSFQNCKKIIRLN